MIRYNKDSRNLLLGPIIFLLSIFILPASIFETLASRAAIGTIAWMAFWWITGPVDYAITAILPIAINALIPIANMTNVVRSLASETLLLLFGASLLTVAWEETGLDKRIASKFLRLVGSNFRRQLIVWFLVSTTLSSVLPNAVVCATITPIALSMLKYIGITDISESRIGSKLLLTIAYAAGIGGLLTPLGGAMNLVTVDYLQKVTGVEFMFGAWVVRFLPISLLLIISNILFLIRDVKKTEDLSVSKEYFEMQSKAMPKMSKEEKVSLILFLIATVLSFSRPLFARYLPSLKPAFAFVICAVLSFFVHKESGMRLMRWKAIQDKIAWQLLFIFGGGLTVGTIINESGAASSIGSLVAQMNFNSEILLILAIICLTLAMSDITTNTATVAIMTPIIVSVVEGIGKNPIPYIYVSTIGVNISYMFPTTIRSIPVGYGLKPKYMFKEGVKLTAIVIILMTTLSYILVKYWDLFNTI